MPAAAMFDIRRLQILVVAARGGSFAAAAEALSFTPSAISQQVSTLEAEAGAVLFERTTRGVRLTDAGRVLVTHAEAVLEKLADARAELDAIAGLRVGELRFGSFSSATSAFAAEVAETFRSEHPGITLQFADGEPYESVARLKARELDLAVVFEFDHWEAGLDYDGERVGFDEELEQVALFDDPYLLVMRRDHRLAGTGPVALGDLTGETVVGGSPWYADLERRSAAQGADLRFDSSFRATGFEAFQAFVGAGRGLTLMPRLALGWMRDSLLARPLEDGPVRHVKLATLARAYPSPAARAMGELVRQRVEELGLADLDLDLDHGGS